MSDNIRGDRAVSFLKHCKSVGNGDFVEVGVFEGNSAVIILQAAYGRVFHLYDTWEGLPALTKEDKKSARKGQFKADKHTVESFLEKMKPNRCRLFFHDGLVQDTFNGEDFPSGIAFLHIDVDLHDTTKFCLEKFWPFMNDGSVVQIDDYGHYPGCRKAVDDFAKKKNLKIHNVFKKQPSPVYIRKSGGI